MSFQNKPEITEQMIDAEIARQDRRRRMAVLLGVAICAQVAIIAATVLITLTVADTADPAPQRALPAPTAAAPASGTESAPQAEAIGQPATNGGITVTVTKVSSPATYPRLSNSVRKNSGYDEYENVAPRSGGRWIRVDATVENNTSTAIDLTCSWPVNALVVDSKNRQYQSVDSLYKIQGTPECNEDLNPGFSSQMTWIYEAPTNATIEYFAFADTALDSRKATYVAITAALR